ncbi:MAG: polysaccharide biosynthesis protein [Bacilli bacterium]|nr:polysaccharide biosynthesis protein [Bacilli bacterium]MDD3895877.1 polysaccharide biosynthesis protein [Bacilli bacterium]MDD4407761.1 polysaccharide biosynthesis protein [Bacilli bacterium]
MKKSSFIEGTFIATASVILVKILGMLYVIPFYIIVGSKGGALYSYAYNIYLIFLSISSAGIPSAISKIISEYNALGMLEAKTRAFKLGKKFIGYFSIAAFIILFMFAEELALLILGNLTGGNTVQDVAFVIRCVSFAILVIPHLSVTKGYLQAHRYITPSSNSNLLEQIVRIFVILTGSYLAYKILDASLTITVGIAVSGAFFGGLIAYIYLLKTIRKNKKELNLDKKYERDNISNKAIVKKIGQYALPFIIINLVTQIYSFTDMVLILRTLDHLGYSAYDVEFITSVISTWGVKLGMIVNSIAMGMTVALIPSIVESYTKKNWIDLNKKFNKALQIIIYVSIPLTLGLSILATPVWTVFYNINHYGGAILQVLIFNSLAVNVYMIVSTSLQSMNKFKAVYQSAIFGFLLNAVLVIPLMILFNNINIPAYYGAILATFISYLVSIYIGLKAIGEEHKMSYKDTYKQVFKILVPSVLMVITLLVMNQFLPFNIYSRTSALKLIVIDAIVGGIIYIGVSYKMGIPNHIFGGKELSKVIKKLTFGKFQIKEK